ncbi:MAG: hypothetical protein JWO58_226 [Chitinophagaceae bacterium]|nr:hypothetical protein [Chitinophagaceae bacterium]
MFYFIGGKMKTKKGIWTACLFALAMSKCWAVNFLVAPAGAAYTSIQTAVNAANAGDTIWVKPGTYNENVVFPRSGSAAAGYITLLGESGAILDGTGKGQLGISILNKNYIRVIGMEVQNFKSTDTPIGISVEGTSSNLEIRNNIVHQIENANGNAHGIAFYGTGATPITNILVDGNVIRNCLLGQSESMVFNGNVTSFSVSNNIVHDNDNIGIDFIGFEGTGPVGSDQARNGVCVNNTVYNISSFTNPTYGGDRSADGIYVDGGLNITIEKNNVYNCDIGIELASEHNGKNTQNITVRNNFVSGSYQANIMAGGYAANRGNSVNIVIVNNTTYQGLGGELALQFNCTNITIQNNIFYGKAGQDYLQEWGNNNNGIVAGNNLYFGESTTSPGAWADASAHYINPKLVATPGNLRLTATSPAINAGLNLGNDGSGNPLSGTQDIDNQARVANGAIDIGAYEYVILLPVELLNFRVSSIDRQSVLLTWQTASEINNDHFEIERCSDPKSNHWQWLGSVVGKGYSATLQHYTFQDEAPAVSNYYRLKQVDVDGQYHYSTWLMVVLHADQPQLNPYPNPVTSTAQIDAYSPSEGTVHVIVYDLLGEIIQEEYKSLYNGMNHVSLDLSHLVPGVYLIQWINGAAAMTCKVWKTQ